MEKSPTNNSIQNKNDKGTELEALETSLDLIEKTLLLNPENQGLSNSELRKLALKELNDSRD